jgi:hypothetical protein
VIKRLDTRNERTLRGQRPQESTSLRISSLYAGRKRFRRLRLMVDADLLGETQGGEAPASGIVGGLMDHPLLEVFRYRDGGPPIELARDDAG